MSPAITLTGVYRDRAPVLVDATDALLERGLPWLDRVRDSDAELYAVWGEVADPCLPEPDEVLAEDSIVAWFDDLTAEATAALTEERPAVLREMASSSDTAIRRAVAENPHTPRILLNRLCSDEDFDVACAAASNPRTSASGHSSLLVRLAGRTAAQVRRAVRSLASSPSVATSTLERARPLVSGDLADLLDARLRTRVSP